MLRATPSSFRGSSNETWSGWAENGNVESFDVFCSWREGTESRRVQQHREYFERLWRGETPQVEVIDLPDAVKQELIERARRSFADVDLSDRQTRGATVRRPLPHQVQALEEWRKQGCRGILQHATGSGKTFTALLAIREHIANGRAAIVVVPSDLLLRQWRDELAHEIAGLRLLVCGAGNSEWKTRGRLEAFTTPAPDVKHRVILSTIQTAAQREFLERVQHPSDLLLVADEVHTAGSPYHSKVLQIQADKRLGLSATPHRFGDPQGTQALLDYFGPVVQPPFTLQDAISAGRLVPYDYYPHVVRLVDAEASEWNELHEPNSGRDRSREPR